MLHEGRARGYPLTERQRRYFGAVASGVARNPDEEWRVLERTLQENEDDLVLAERLTHALARVGRLPRGVKPEAVSFFYANAAYAASHRFEGAVNLARAEVEGERRGWQVQWEFDDDPDLSWLGPEDPLPREVLVVLLKNRSGTQVLSSLGGIVDPDDAYGRVIAAQLASEALASEDLHMPRRWNPAIRANYIALPHYFILVTGPRVDGTVLLLARGKGAAAYFTQQLKQTLGSFWETTGPSLAHTIPDLAYAVVVDSPTLVQDLERAFLKTNVALDFSSYVGQGKRSNPLDEERRQLARLAQQGDLVARKKLDLLMRRVWGHGLHGQSRTLWRCAQRASRHYEVMVEGPRVYESEDGEYSLVSLYTSGKGAGTFFKGQFQTTLGASWEADGPDFAYTMVVDSPTLVRDLQDEFRGTNVTLNFSPYGGEGRSIRGRRQ